ncbi:methyltransferase domain-containing protein, partial [Streptomyces badius]
TEGRPDADQFGLTVTDRGQHVWLRDPSEVIRPARVRLARPGVGRPGG